MTPETSLLPINGPVVLTLAAYGLLSAFVMGPAVAEREIERSDWPKTCLALLEATLPDASYGWPDPTASELPDVTKLMRDVMPELDPLWDMIPNPNAIVQDSIRQKEAAAKALRTQSRSTFETRCTCAEATYIGNQRIDLALYAGSARTIVPQAVTHREAALTRALMSPACDLSRRAAR